MIIRKIRGKYSHMPSESIQIHCIHELIIQTLQKYVTYNPDWSTLQTNNPSLTLDFIKNNIDLLANPYSTAQEMLIKATFAVVNHPQYYDILKTNIAIFRDVIENLHTNLNYNTLLDCTVFKVPKSVIRPKLNDQTTYYLIIQTKSIISDIKTIKNFSSIQRKCINICLSKTLYYSINRTGM